MFILNPSLEQDTTLIGTFALSQVRLHKDSRYPWLMLVPARPDLTEIHHLNEAEQRLLTSESSLLAAVMETELQPDSMNIAALDNMVSQLHIHHVARFQGDAAWPGPIWDIRSSAIPYEDDALQQQVTFWQKALSETEGFIAATAVDIELEAGAA